MPLLLGRLNPARRDFNIARSLLSDDRSLGEEMVCLGYNSSKGSRTSNSIYMYTKMNSFSEQKQKQDFSFHHKWNSNAFFPISAGGTLQPPLGEKTLLLALWK